MSTVSHYIQKANDESFRKETDSIILDKLDLKLMNCGFEVDKIDFVTKDAFPITEHFESLIDHVCIDFSS